MSSQQYLNLWEGHEYGIISMKVTLAKKKKHNNTRRFLPHLAHAHNKRQIGSGFIHKIKIMKWKKASVMKKKFTSLSDR